MNNALYRYYVIDYPHLLEQIFGDSPWEKLAYNPLAGAKYASVGRLFPLK